MGPTTASEDHAQIVDSIDTCTDCTLLTGHAKLGFSKSLLSLDLMLAITGLLLLPVAWLLHPAHTIFHVWLLRTTLSTNANGTLRPCSLA